MIIEQLPVVTIEFFKSLVTHPVFIATFLAWLLSQGLKVVLMTIKNKAFSSSYFLTRGSMPSSHTATVTALVMAVYLAQGMTVLTAVVFLWAIIVVRELMDVNIGLKKNKIEQRRTYIHKPIEILVGFIVGFVVPFLVF